MEVHNKKVEMDTFLQIEFRFARSCQLNDQPRRGSKLCVSFR